jgi:hypothetical protein
LILMRAIFTPAIRQRLIAPYYDVARLSRHIHAEEHYASAAYYYAMY